MRDHWVCLHARDRNDLAPLDVVCDELYALSAQHAQLTKLLALNSAHLRRRVALHDDLLELRAEAAVSDAL